MLAVCKPVIPYRIETLFQHEPWANKLLFGATIATSLALQFGTFSDEAVNQYFVWGEGGPLALVGYMFAHAGVAHLAGNMVFLWVFGDAVCATVGNWTYLALYLGLGAFAGLVHQLVGGGPVVGASGAITGVVGVAVAFYPSNRVNIFYSLGLIPRTSRVWLWAIALYWSAWDVIGAAFSFGPVAYWAHLGGTAAGLATGLILLATGRVQLTEFDNGSLLDFFLHREPPHRLQAFTDEALAELRRAEMAFAPAPTPAVTTPTIRLGNGASIDHETSAWTGDATAASAASSAPRPRFKTLPDVGYFLFDRTERRGPMSRAEFLASLAGAPDTTGWWYWGESMADWQPVETLRAPVYRLATRPGADAAAQRA
jgi:membrane associated rhomboid family serine protease